MKKIQRIDIEITAPKRTNKRYAAMVKKLDELKKKEKSNDGKYEI